MNAMAFPCAAAVFGSQTISRSVSLALPAGGSRARHERRQTATPTWSSTPTRCPSGRGRSAKAGHQSSAWALLCGQLTAAGRSTASRSSGLASDAGIPVRASAPAGRRRAGFGADCDLRATCRRTGAETRATTAADAGHTWYGVDRDEGPDAEASASMVAQPALRVPTLTTRQRLGVGCQKAARW